MVCGGRWLDLGNGGRRGRLRPSAPGGFAEIEQSLAGAVADARICGESRRTWDLGISLRRGRCRISDQTSYWLLLIRAYSRGLAGMSGFGRYVVGIFV